MTQFAVVFDFDGLILDTEVPIYESWRRCYERHGQELTMETWSVCLGTGEEVLDPHRELERLTGLSFDREELHQTNRAWVLEQLEHSKPMPGVLKLLEEAERLGCRIGLASSSPCEWVHHHLERLGLMDRFETVRCRDHVEKTKPDPALYNLALSDLKMKPQRAVVFEDSLNGVKAAKAAGIYCIAVPNRLTRLMDLSGADRTVASLEEVDLEEVIEITADEKTFRS